MGRKITTVIIVILVLALIASFPFAEQIIPQDIYAEYGALVLIAPFVLLIIIVIIIGAIANRTKNKTPDLEEKRKLLGQELKEAEKKFLKHKIDQNTFDSISKKKNEEIITIESEIDSQKKPMLNESDMKKIDGISQDKKKVIAGLLEQKQKKVHELKLTERSYLKRKIDEKTFRKINSKISEELISIEGKIKSIQTAEEIKKVQEELKKGAKEISKQKKSSKDRKKKLSELEILEEDLLSQMSN